MTLDLDAIRARHQPVAGLRDDEGHLFEPATFCRHCVTLWPCDADALLAEVDRLRGDNAVLSDAMVDRNIDRWDRGVAAERARIHAAVEGLPTPPRLFALGAYDREAVLAAIDGEDPK